MQRARDQSDTGEHSQLASRCSFYVWRHRVTRFRTPTISPGAITRWFTEEEAHQLVADWLAVFGKHRRGVNTKAYLWHIFSGDRYPSVSGTEAIETYQKQMASEFVVLSNDGKVAFVTDRLPESSSLDDFYVFPPNFAWTMAFTHEAGWLGPYFALHPQFTKLNEENKLRVRKAHEAKVAHQKGWF